MDPHQREMKSEKGSDEVKDEIDFKYNLRIYIGLLKKYKSIFFLLLLVIFVTESLKLGEKFLFKILVDNGELFAAGTLQRAGFVHIILIVLGIALGITLVNGVMRFLFHHFINHLDANLIFDVKKKYFDHLTGLSQRFHTTHKTGSLISRLIRAGGAIERLTDVIAFNFVPVIFQLIVVGVTLLFFDPLSTLILFIIVAVFVLYSYWINHMQKSANMIYNNLDDREKANISDFFMNIDSIKYYGKEKSVQARYAQLSHETKTALLKNWDYFRWLDGGQIVILGIGTILMVAFPLHSFLDGSITLGSLVFIYTAYISLLGPLYGVVHGMRNYYRAMADFEPLFQYGKIDNDIKDDLHAKELMIKEGTIEFKNVTFKYHDRDILKEFTLKIPANKKIAIVGPSGAGKSTIIKLIYRLYDTTEGNILIDKKDVRLVKQESLRSALSIVPQECVLFDDTIYDNIRFSNPLASREEVLTAIRFAQLDKIIETFPQKENTIVGERGVRLSGGEKQRVSIARALLANKKILILDEATSSLDSETEAEIQKDLARLMQGRTTIIIAHRLSTIMHADNIVVIENGRIVQQGTHNDLIKKKGMYHKLWNLQKGGYLQS
jgi:ABC-type multidrug transport system fused ATPase/permease subunit